MESKRRDEIGNRLRHEQNEARRQDDARDSHRTIPICRSHFSPWVEPGLKRSRSTREYPDRRDRGRPM
jgi:hypothetical protein